MFRTGDRVAVESVEAGVDRRAGTVTRVAGQVVRVHWDDGHDSAFVPPAGSMQLMPPRPGNRPRQRVSRGSAQAFDDGAVGLTAAFAHRLEPVSPTGRFQVVEQGRRHPHA